MLGAIFVLLSIDIFVVVVVAVVVAVVATFLIVVVTIEELVLSVALGGFVVLITRTRSSYGISKIRNARHLKPLEAKMRQKFPGGGE